MSLMDAHEDAVLNNINTTFASPSEAFALSIQAPHEDAMSTIAFQADDDEDEHQEMDLTRNGDTPTDASSLASATSWSSDTPSPRDFEDYYDYPPINETFDEAGMQALLEEEYLQSLIQRMHIHSPERIGFHLIPEPCTCRAASDSSSIA